MNWLKRIFRRGNLYSDLNEELRQHIEEKAEQLVREGMSREEAEQAAKRAFGNPTLIEERSREVWQWPTLESIWVDIKYALRQLRKSPGFAVTAVLVLALGVAASVCIFAFVNAALLKPLPYENPSRLVSANESSGYCNECNLPYLDYLDWKRANKVFSSFEVWEPTSYLWRNRAGVEARRAGRVSGGFFRTLGVTALLGRVFTDSDDTPGAPRTVVLPYGTWQRDFGGRPDILGQSITLDDLSYTVIGVLPSGFQFAMRAADFWTTIHDPDSCDQDRACSNTFGIARLKDGASVQAALADTRTIAARLEQEYPVTNTGRGATVKPLKEDIVGEIRPILLVLLSGAGLLLLIACINVASLLLVRAENRKHELALRGALGASRLRLLQQFVTEGVVLVAFGMAFGLAAAYGTMHLLLKLIPERVMRGMPYLQQLGFDSRVWLFACAIAVLAIAVFSITPALRLSISNLRNDLAEGGRSSSGTTWKRFGSNLVAVELAVAMVLLVGAGLLGESFYRLLHVELNFQPDHLATLEIDASRMTYGNAQGIEFSQRLIDRVSAMPGVISVGHTSILPVTCLCLTRDFRVLGQPWNGEQNEDERAISPGYFKVLQARLISGRFFTDADDPSKPPVIIINRTLAKLYFPHEDPIGRTIGDQNLSPQSLRKIVGVVDDIREGGLDEQLRPAVYHPFSQGPDGMFLVVRTAQDPATRLPALVAAVRQIDPNVGVRNEFTMTEHIGDTPTAYLHRASSWIVGGFAALALLLGVIGLYGVIAYSVSRRTREIGVRMALGAQRGSVCLLILKEAGWLTLIGLILGIAGSIAAGMLMRSLLFGVRSWDISILGVVTAVLAASALLASFIPARRAASVNPVEALRSE
jgi:predicted permease